MRMKRVCPKFPCRIYALESNPFGRDDFRLQGIASSKEELLEKISSIRLLFHDSYAELDRYVYLSDELENRLNVKPSDVLRQFGGDKEKEIARQVRSCRSCYHLVDETMNYCQNFGTPGCLKKITISAFWKSPDGKKKIKDNEKKEREYWEGQPQEKKEIHELNERYDVLLEKHSQEKDESKLKEINSKMDEIVSKLKSLDSSFINWRL